MSKNAKSKCDVICEWLLRSLVCFSLRSSDATTTAKAQTGQAFFKFNSQEEER